MPQIDSHKPGSFCWIELGTSDQQAAKSFYTSLFGWTFNEFPIGPGQLYTIFQLEGRDAAAGYTMGEDLTKQGVPPHWLLYIAVKSADSSARSVAELGGKVLKEPFDVMNSGRMAVAQDPAGATFAVWEPKTHHGVGIAGVDGTLCWADLSTPDQEAGAKFYSGLFGWKLEFGPHDREYLHIKNGEDFIGGIQPASQRNPNAPPHWLAYWMVSDCKAAAAKAKTLGATFYLEPMEMENVGTYAVMADPQGAVSALFQAAPRG